MILAVAIVLYLAAGIATAAAVLVETWDEAPIQIIVVVFWPLVLVCMIINSLVSLVRAQLGNWLDR